LDSILSTMKLSTFLNQIDGIDQTDDGLLLVATTNYPESLDPAINNRPGRFDVVVEVGPPTKPLRLQYFKRCTLQSLGTSLIEELASTTRGLSFAQLREIESLSGLIAVRAGRRARIPEDVREAAKIVLLSHTQASRGFPSGKTKAGFVAEQLDE
jgi:ATP-dependent 26S proteasome regulatory subunit